MPAYFGLLKFYISAIFVVILINGIYPLWAMDYTCRTNFELTGREECLKVVDIYYLDFDV